MSVANSRISFDPAQIRAFCERNQIRKLALFGSILTDRFRPTSDIDVLVEFEAEAPWSLFDLLDMAHELTALFGREVHLVEKDAIRNPYRRHSILNSRKVIYAT